MPMRSYKDIDEYIGGFPPEIQKILIQIRLVLHESAPKAEEAIRYGMPTLRLNGKNLIHFAAYRSHIGLYPTPGPVEEFREELSRYETSRGTIRFPLDEPVPYELIGKIARSRVRQVENK